VVSLQTVDSLTTDKRAVWRTIRKGLEDISITTAAFKAIHDFTFDWFIHAVKTGALKSTTQHLTTKPSPYAQRPCLPGIGHGACKTIMRQTIPVFTQVPF